MEEELITGLVSDGRYGTSRTYVKSVSSFRTFLLSESGLPSGAASVTVTVEEMDDLLIYRYNRYLTSRGVIRNSISFYNRTLRAIYNKCIRRYRIPDRHPFMDVYTGVDRTRSRAVSETVISRLMTLDLTRDKSLELTRDLFLFSYMTRGMSFVDMAYLKKENIHGDYITYSRKKTGTRMEVHIERPIREILNKYARKESVYLLPILQCHDTESGESLYRIYQIHLTVYNRKLKELSKLTGVSSTITSYVSRHSWATAARNNNIPLSVISEGLGHSSERMTRIYLGSFNQKLIDDAGRKMMMRMRVKGS